MTAKLLFVDDHWQEIRDVLSSLPSEIEVICEAVGGRALAYLERDRDIKAVLLDLQFDDQPKQGAEILREIKDRHPNLPVIILTSISSVKLALDLVFKERSAYHYFCKGEIDRDQLAKEIENAVGYYDLRSDALRKTDRGLIIGASQRLLEVLELAARASQRDAVVLITGESGTGKELIARSVHLNSRRKNLQFVAVNCGALPDDLIESELFGHVQGAFTGATRDRKGLFEVANGGTIFLDELGELPLDQQVKLLRVLEDGEIRKVGSSRLESVDVRVITATNRDLAQMVKDKRFREDLYYRLNVLTIHMPALRDRREDIPALVSHILTDRLGSRAELSGGALEVFKRYEWPGNVRELQNKLERILVSVSTDIIDAADLAPFFDPSASSDSAGTEAWVRRILDGQAGWADLKREFKTSAETLRTILDAIIRQWIRERGERPSGNDLARLLDIKRNHVNQILDTAGLTLKEYDG